MEADDLPSSPLFRIRRTPHVPAPASHNAPYSLLEREADEVVESYMDPIAIDFPLQNPRFWHNCLLERDTLQGLIDHANTMNNTVLNPIGRNGLEREVPMVEVENAIRNNVLTQAEHHHLLHAVTQYKRRTARRDAWKSKVEYRVETRRQAQQVAAARRAESDGSDVNTDDDSIVAQAQLNAMDAGFSPLAHLRRADALGLSSESEEDDDSSVVPENLLEDGIDNPGAAGGTSALAPGASAAATTGTEALHAAAAVAAVSVSDGGAGSRAARAAGRQGVPNDMLNDGTDPAKKTLHLFIGIMKFIQQSEGSFGNFSSSKRKEFFERVHGQLFDRSSHGPLSNYPPPASWRTTYQKFIYNYNICRARTCLDNHSPAGGDAGETLPEHLRLVLECEEALKSEPTASARAAAARRANAEVESSLIGHQRPLGPGAPAFRTQTTRNSTTVAEAVNRRVHGVQSVFAPPMDQEDNPGQEQHPLAENRCHRGAASARQPAPQRQRRASPMPATARLPGHHLPGAQRQDSLQATGNMVAIGLLSTMMSHFNASASSTSGMSLVSPAETQRDDFQKRGKHLAKF
jgi:hypothetical protein